MEVINAVCGLRSSLLYLQVRCSDPTSSRSLSTPDAGLSYPHTGGVVRGRHTNTRGAQASFLNIFRIGREHNARTDVTVGARHMRVSCLRERALSRAHAPSVSKPR